MPADPRGSSAACPEVRELLIAALDGELSQEEERDLQQHLKACASCRLRVEEHRTVWALLDTAPVPPPPVCDSEFLRELRLRIRRSAARRRAWTLSGAAAAAVIAASGLAFWPTRAEDPAIIENLAVLEDLQPVRQEGEARVSEVGRAILALLAEGEPGEAEDSLDLLESALHDPVLYDQKSYDTERRG